MWMFLTAFLACYLVFQVILRTVPVFRKPFLSKRQMAEEVNEAAITSFFLNGLHRTRDQTGIIIYVSVYERMVQVLADKGINDKVSPEVWQEVVGIVTRSMRERNPAEGICTAVQRCGELITEHFPIKSDDTDELPNLIVDGVAKG
jgi:putative membrane protein